MFRIPLETDIKPTGSLGEVTRTPVVFLVAGAVVDTLEVFDKWGLARKRDFDTSMSVYQQSANKKAHLKNSTFGIKKGGC